MSFQECQKTKNHSDQQGSHLKASVRYLVYSRLSGLQPGGGVAVTSSFSQIVSFSPSTLGKQRFQTVPFSNRSTLESVFETIRFRTVVVWMVAVSGTKQYRFRLKRVWCGRGLKCLSGAPGLHIVSAKDFLKIARLLFIDITSFSVRQ